LTTNSGPQPKKKRRSFSKKALPKEGKSYEEIKQHFSNVGAGKTMSRSVFKKRKARNVVMKTVFI
jgi:hypothetical protein